MSINLPFRLIALSPPSQLVGTLRRMDQLEEIGLGTAGLWCVAQPHFMPRLRTSGQADVS